MCIFVQIFNWKSNTAKRDRVQLVFNKTLFLKQTIESFIAVFKRCLISILIDYSCILVIYLYNLTESKTPLTPYLLFYS